MLKEKNLNLLTQQMIAQYVSYFAMQHNISHLFSPRSFALSHRLSDYLGYTLIFAEENRYIATTHY